MVGSTVITMIDDVQFWVDFIDFALTAITDGIGVEIIILETEMHLVRTIISIMFIFKSFNSFYKYGNLNIISSITN